MVDLRQSLKYAKYLRTKGWRVEKVNDCYIFIRKIPLTPFSIIKVQRPKVIPLKRLDQLAKKYHAFQIAIEPDSNVPRDDYRKLKIYGYHLTKSSFLPTKTIQLDLTQSEEKILGQMKKDARYGIQKAKEKGVQINEASPPVEGRGFLEQGKGRLRRQASILASFRPRPWRGDSEARIKETEIKKFRQAWWQAAGWRRYVPSLKTLNALQMAFGKMAIFLKAARDKTISKAAESSILLNEQTIVFRIRRNLSRLWRPGQGKKDKCRSPWRWRETVGGTIILKAGKTAYYYYAFTSREGRRNFAQYLLVWETIKLAKKQGCKIFDLEGTYDERFPNKSWRGFSHFKKSFGGKEIEYPGCFVKWKIPFPFPRKQPQ